MKTKAPKKNEKILKQAQQVVNNVHLKRLALDVIDNYAEDVKDVIVIFVTSNNEADTYWNHLDRKNVLKVLHAIEGGLK